MDPKTIIRELTDQAWSQGNLDLVDRHVDAGWRNHDPNLPDIGRGPAGYREAVRRYRTAFPDLRLTIERQIAEGDTVVTLWRGTGTNKGRLMDLDPTNRRVEVTGVDIDRFENGKIAESWVQYDALGMMQQLGFVPKGGPAEERARGPNQPEAK